MRIPVFSIVPVHEIIHVIYESEHVTGYMYMRKVNKWPLSFKCFLFFSCFNTALNVRWKCRFKWVKSNKMEHFYGNKIWDLVPLRFSLSIYTVHIYLQLIFLLTFEPNNRDITLINICKIQTRPHTISIALRFNIISLNITIHLCIHVFRQPTAMHNK